MEEDDDPVVQEIPVYLSQGLRDKLYLYQYPLNYQETYENSNIIKSKIKPQNEEVFLELGLDCQSANFDYSKAEQIAVNADGHQSKKVKSDKKDEPFFPHNVMDKYVLTSMKTPCQKLNYAVGIYHSKELHLTPVHSILQMRPSFGYLDKSDKRAKEDAKEAGEAPSDEEEEEAKLITVKFSNKQTERAQQAREKSFSYQAKKREQEKWYNTEYYEETSRESELSRGFLYCSKCEERVPEVNEEPVDYLKKLVNDMELEDPHMSLADMPFKALKTLPLSDQIKTVLQNVKVLRFSELTDMFPDEKPGDMLKVLQQLAVLVRGNWIVRSDLIYPKDSKCGSSGVSSELMCRGRDYILYLFTQQKYVERCTVTAAVKLPVDEMKEILQGVSELCKKGWKFAHPTDKDFISRHPEIVQRQSVLWEAKHRQLLDCLHHNTLYPERKKSTRDSSVSSSDGEMLQSPSRTSKRRQKHSSTDCESGADAVKRTLLNIEESRSSVNSVLMNCDPIVVKSEPMDQDDS